MRFGVDVDHGASETVGLQDSATRGDQVLCNTGTLENPDLRSPTHRSRRAPAASAAAAASTASASASAAATASATTSTSATSATARHLRRCAAGCRGWSG